MSDYIRREDAIDDLHTQLMYRMGSDDMKRRLDDWAKTLPSADVVPVIRCKDCKHCYFADNRVPDEQGWVCEINSSEPVNLNGFCSYGERRKQE